MYLGKVETRQRISVAFSMSSMSDKGIWWMIMRLFSTLKHFDYSKRSTIDRCPGVCTHGCSGIWIDCMSSGVNPFCWLTEPTRLREMEPVFDIDGRC